ncbi:MAG: BMP family protein [Pseudobdellovibrionaceae bacterium]
MRSLFSFILVLFFAQISFAFQVGLVLDRGGKDDKSFNNAAYEGVMKAQKELGITSKVVEAIDNNSFDVLLRQFASRNYDLVIAVGFAQKDAVSRIAKQFPKVQFAVVDAEVGASNVRSLLFEEHEGSFLVGALAALTTKSNKIGFIGGMDIPMIRRFEMGYIAGAKHINPKINVSSNFIGVTSEAWNNPAKAKELSLSQYAAGVDVIFGAAGASTMGIFDAAEDKKQKAIGVDSNQNWVKPGYILTSMLKRVDVAVFDSVKLAKDGKFTGGIMRFGLESNGVDYALDQHNEKLISTDMSKKIDEIKKQIIAKKIDVPDFYKKK